MYKRKENVMPKIESRLSRHQYEIFNITAQTKKTTKSNLLALLIDQELCKEKPFDFEIDIKLPDRTFAKDDYIEEIEKIQYFLGYFLPSKGTNSLALDAIIRLRYDMNIPNRDKFLRAFKCCLDEGIVKKFTRYHPSDRCFYRVVRS